MATLFGTRTAELFPPLLRSRFHAAHSRKYLRGIYYAINKIPSRTTLYMLHDRLFWVKPWGLAYLSLAMNDSPSLPRLINNPSHHPMPVIRHIDQQSREIHAGQLGTDFIFGKGGKQGIVEITA